MATSQNILDYLLDQLQSARNVRARKMFGEYALYCDDKVVALVCDNQLFVKITPAGKTFIGDRYEEGCAYKGAKPSMLITADYFDDGDWLSQLIRITADALPAPKPKKPKDAGKRRAKDSAGPFVVTWVEVAEMPPCGHGVEFHHQASHHSGILVAFLEGFAWLHGQSKTVTVRILSAQAQPFDDGAVDAKTILKDTRSAVNLFLDDSKRWRHGAVTGKVSVIFNA